MKVIVFTIKKWTWPGQMTLWDIYRNGVWMFPGERTMKAAQDRVQKYVQEIKDAQ